MAWIVCCCDASHPVATACNMPDVLLPRGCASLQAWSPSTWHVRRCSCSQTATRWWSATRT
jgi:hypothetical protein